MLHEPIFGLRELFVVHPRACVAQKDPGKTTGGCSFRYGHHGQSGQSSQHWLSGQMILLSTVSKQSGGHWSQQSGGQLGSRQQSPSVTWLAELLAANAGTGTRARPVTKAYRTLFLPFVRVPLPALASSRTASMRPSRSAAGRSAALGLTDGRNGLATDQAVARLMTADPLTAVRIEELIAGSPVCRFKRKIR